MGALQIDCYCNDWQMNSIVKLIRKNIYDNSDLDEGIGDNIDELFGEFRIYVEFEDRTDIAVIKDISLQDEDYTEYYYDTVVLTQRLKPIIEQFNSDLEYNRKQGEAIKQDQLKYEYY